MHHTTKSSQGAPPLGHIDHDEQMLCEIRRHPIGLISLYGGALLAMLLVCIGLILVMPTISSLQPELVPAIIGGLLFLGLFILIGLYIATVVYRDSALIVTDKNITQTLQQSLFNRKISQLSMANVEDVTAEQNGFLAHIFDYGTLYIETAGEQENFHFIYTPHPNTIAKEVLEAREKYIEHPREQVARYYQSPPQQPPQPQQQPASSSELPEPLDQRHE